jgi:hypothetical protein
MGRTLLGLVLVVCVFGLPQVLNADGRAQSPDMPQVPVQENKVAPSPAGTCQELLAKVDDHPIQKIWELFESAPSECKMALKTAIFERRRIIVDDFPRR